MSDLSRDQILGADDLVIQSIAVPEWKGTVFIRTLTAGEHDRFEGRQQKDPFTDVRASGRGLPLQRAGQEPLQRGRHPGHHRQVLEGPRSDLRPVDQAERHQPGGHRRDKKRLRAAPSGSSSSGSRAWAARSATRPRWTGQTLRMAGLSPARADPRSQLAYRAHCEPDGQPLVQVQTRPEDFIPRARRLKLRPVQTPAEQLARFQALAAAHNARIAPRKV